MHKSLRLFQVLWGLWLFYFVRGELQTTRELGEQLLTLAYHIGDPALLLQAHHALGPTMLTLGELAAAHVHFAHGIALYDPQQHRSHALLYGGHDPGVCCQYFLALVLWLQGYPDQALQRSRTALTVVHGLAHPHSLAMTLNFGAWLGHFRREDRAVQELAEAAITLATE
jgi:predicted ATPase